MPKDFTEGHLSGKPCTVNLYRYQESILQKMGEEGIIASRSDALRQGIDLLIEKNLVMLQTALACGSKIDKTNNTDTKYDMRSKATLDKIRNMFEVKQK